MREVQVGRASFKMNLTVLSLEDTWSVEASARPHGVGSKLEAWGQEPIGLGSCLSSATV